MLLLGLGISFQLIEIVLRESQWAKHRVVMLPDSLETLLKDHPTVVREPHGRNLADGLGRVPVPNALVGKYLGTAGESGWQRVSAEGHCLRNPPDRRAGAAAHR